jgi:hypothetical protein
VREGFVSAGQAAERYGVVVDPAGTVDEAATRARRGG